MTIETNSQRILEAVRTKNVNGTSIYIVGLEIVLAQSLGADLLVHLAEQNNGKLKLLGYEQLLKYAAQDSRGAN